MRKGTVAQWSDSISHLSYISVLLCVCVCLSCKKHTWLFTVDSWSLVVCLFCACDPPPPPPPTHTHTHTQCLQLVRWTISAVLCYFTAYVNQLQEAYMTLFTVDSCKAIDVSFNNADAVHPDKTICAGSVNNVWPCLVSRMLLLGQHT